MVLTIVLSVLLVLLVLGTAVGFSFGIAGTIGVFLSGINSSTIASIAFQSLDSFPLMAIPFFILAGDLMKEGGLSERLIHWINSFVGKIRGGLGVVMVVACTFFGAISGSSVATVAAIGSIMIPIMEKYGYERRYSSALAAASGFLGILIPPSIPLIIYGITANVSIGDLFLSTVFPGLLLAIFYIIVNFVFFKKYHTDPANNEMDIMSSNMGKSTISALPAIILPIIILGGIYGGAFTPTEAAAVAVIYSFVVGFFIYRGLSKKNIKRVLLDSALTSSVLLILMALVSVLGRYLTLENVPLTISGFLTDAFDNKYMFLLVINLLFLLIGMFMETNTAILLFTPLLIPALKQLGIDPVHFGAILVLNLGIGSITPPFAANLFVANRISGVPVTKMLAPLLPFLFLAGIPVLFIVTYIPWLSMWLPSLFK
ncbi:TRAP transporter large permease [Bacillus sp. FJAT-29814]|uniref:TRAP transporter large permease n=1 Tax=Bacillus sp. FJAT-29814 TaxID=1729688 RepID=UPI0008326A17|nr:TRAP transporter large permease [Bacillus sp. FJAT-29814]